MTSTPLICPSTRRHRPTGLTARASLVGLDAPLSRGLPAVKGLREKEGILSTQTRKPDTAK